MPKSSGLGAGLFVSGYDLSGDTGAVNNIAGGPDLLDVPGIDQSAVERIGGRRRGAIDWQAWFNDATDQEHAALSTLPTADRIVTYCHRKAAVGDLAASMVAKQINYDPTRAADGALTIAVQATPNGFGLEWGELLTPGIRTDSAATNGTNLDNGAQTTDGAQAYLHVFGFTGTDVTVTIEDSPDDVTYSTLASFTEVSALGGARNSERIAVAGTVERHTRVITTTVSGFSDLQFAVELVRNELAVTF